MSNRALLLASGTSAPPRDYEPNEALLGANYSVPLLWLSMFTVDDMCLWPSTLDESATYTALVSSAKACISRSHSRLSRWAERWPVAFATLSQQWPDFLRASDASYFSVWTEDLSDMSGDDEWAEMLRTYLTGLDDAASTGFTEALRQSSLSVDPADPSRLVTPDDSDLGTLAAGYSWASTAPWGPRAS